MCSGVLLLPEADEDEIGGGQKRDLDDATARQKLRWTSENHTQLRRKEGWLNDAASHSEALQDHHEITRAGNVLWKSTDRWIGVARRL